jgi:hypothetical protein
MQTELLVMLAKEMRDHIDSAIAPLIKRIAYLESREPIAGPKGDPGADGKSIAIDSVKDMIEGLHAKHAMELERRATDYLHNIKVRDGIDGKDGRDGVDGKHGMDGRDGKDSDPSEVARHLLPMMRKEVEPALKSVVSEEVAKIPLPQDGKDGRDGADGEPGRNGADGKDGKDGKDGAPGIDGKDGRDSDPSEVAKIILPLLRTEAHAIIERAIVDEVAKIPQPKDGKDGRDGINGEPGRDGINGKDGAPGIDGKDGINGKDGAPGEKGLDGRDVSQDMVDLSVAKFLDPVAARIELNLERKTYEWLDRSRDELRKMFDAVPKPKDGRDGIGVKDLFIEYDNNRTVSIKSKTESGDVVHEVYMPIPIYQDIWKADIDYAKNDLVTHDGSMWIALDNSKNVRPGHMQKAWKLIVKRGRDAK